MHWQEIRVAFPDRWVLIEALEAHTDGVRRRLDRIAVIETCSDGASAFNRYRELHRREPQRELYHAHTSREELEIYEERWLGAMFG